MGVYELHPLNSPGMHWQQDRHQMLAAAYDPSRDLSPNLPCQESSDSSGCSTSSSSGGSTCCKSEYTPCRECSGASSPQTATAAAIAVAVGGGHTGTGGTGSNVVGGLGSGSGAAGSGGGGGLLCGGGSDTKSKCTIGGGSNLPPPGCGGGGGGAGGGTTTGLHEDVICAGCNGRITDRFYLFAVDRKWHASCLQCSQCRVPLDGEVTCFARDGSIFCKKDYYRLFGMKRCGRCQAAILSSELVMRARELVFHVHCFTCAICSSLLTKGDTFGMRDGAVFCRLHYSELPPLSPYGRSGGGPPHGPTQPPPGLGGGPGGGSGGGGGGPGGGGCPPGAGLPPQPPPQQQQPDPQGQPHFPHGPEFHPRLGPHPTPPLPPPTSVVVNPDTVKMANSFFNGAPPAPRQKGRPRKRKPKDLEGMTANLDLNAESYLDVAFGPGTPGLGSANGSHHQRTKRMRTSFKHHQLRTMKSYFAINHNPDAKDLKQLSQKTGLPKRVLQVWFQNARAKWRRMVLKQEGSGGGGIGKGDKLGETALEGYHHGGGLGPHGASPTHYLSPSPLECSS